MYFHDILLAFVAFVSEFLGTLSGFGSSTFFVPLALFFESARFVLALTAILHCFGNLWKIVLFRNHFEWKVFLLLAIPSVFFTAVGALLVARYGTSNVQRVLGIFFISFALYSLFGPKRPPRLPQWAVVVLSSVSGLATGFMGTGGALRGIALAGLHIPKESFVVLSSAIDVGGDLLRAFIYLENGFMLWDQWFYIPILAIAAFAGAKMGQICLRRINQLQFEKIVSVFILGSGVLMLF